MAQHGAVNGGRGRGCLFRPWLTLVGAALLAGCQAPAARVAGCDVGDPNSSRRAVLARQLAADSAVELGERPLRAGASTLIRTADTLAAAGQGTVGKRLLLPLRGPPGPVEPCRPTLDPAALEADLKKVTCCDLQPAQIALYPDGAEALASLLALIDGASGRIDVLMFLWEDDAVGRALARRLAAKAAAGVPVRVLVDGGGNLIYGRPEGAPAPQVNRAVCWLARQPNVALLRTRNGGARFDHRKLVVVDGQVAWTGGRNFNEAAFFRQNDVSFTLTGPLAGDLATEFERFWKEQGGGNDCRWPMADGRWDGDDRQGPNLARIVGTGPPRHDLADALFCAIAHARHHVYLENPYLCDSRMLLRLIEARRRGVDVRVVLTLDTTPPIASRANRVTANYLLRAGVRVYLARGTTHLKALSVDGAWAYLGTGNFDPLSLRHDYELGVAVSDGPVIRAVEEALLVPDLRPEWELKEPLPVTAHDCLSEIIACLFG
jgi:cardiolipin synthase